MAGASSRTFDDGVTVWYDGDGNAVYAADANGNQIAVPPAAGSPIVQQFAALFNLGIRAALDPLYNAAANKAGTPANKPAVTPAQMQLLLLAAGAFLLYKLAR